MGYRSLAALQRDLAGCRRCLAAGYPIDPRPVVEGTRTQHAYLLGLAPGRVEADVGRPWRGRAGVTLRRWLRLDDDAFTRAFYCASITRCYPGRSPDGRGDRHASIHEQRLCEDWLVEELRLLSPRLIVTVGALAARRLLDVPRLADAVGKSFVIADAVAIPLPHPSGASSWLNDPVNRARLGKALVHVRRELRELAPAEPGSRRIDA